MDKKPAVIRTELDGLSVRLGSFVFNHNSGRDEIYYLTHSHHAFELHFVTKGGIDLVTNDCTYRLLQGMVGIVRPDIYHTTNNWTEDFEKRTFVFEITCGESIGIDAETVLRAMASGEVIIEDSVSVTAPIEQLYTELLSGKPGRITYIKCLIQIILLELARNFVGRDAGAEEVAADLTLQRDIIIDEFFISRYYPLGGEAQLAAQLSISKRQLRRILKDRYNQSFREKILEIKLEMAKELLLTTKKSVIIISELLGYTSPSSFIAFFKKQTGITPTQLRVKGQG